MHTPIRPIRPLRKDLIVYWTSTGLIAAVMIFSIISFTFIDRFPFPNGTESAFAHLGLPPYFKVELTIAKLLGVIALVVPAVPHRIREIAYVGFGITLISASVAHFSVGDAARPPLYAMYIIDPLIFLGLLTISYRYYHRLFRAAAVA
ncbi:MAG: DoxX family protein [Kofleriaceae bacterium]|nr:DoxX family protein [Kofleriaceae bacterium]